MAYNVALLYPAQVRGILVFSGRLLEESRQHHAPVAEVRRVNFFISHGWHDDKLPVHHASQAADFLRTLDVSPWMELFEGGHEVPTANVTAARRWLAQLA